MGVTTGHGASKQSAAERKGEHARQLLSRDARRAQLLRAAATAFAREGFAATSMEDVGAEAGVTKLIVYRHFTSKEALYRDVLTQVSERLHDEFLRGLALPDAERHGFMSRSILIVAREDPDGFRLLTTHAAREGSSPSSAGTSRSRACTPRTS